MELTVHHVFSRVLRFLCLSGTAAVIALHGGMYISDTAYAQHLFVFDIDTMVMTQIVIKSPVDFVRTFRIDFLNLIDLLLILRRPVDLPSGTPFVII